MRFGRFLPVFCVTILLTTLSTFAEGTSSSTPPATTIKPKLKINVLAGVNVSDEQIKDMVKKANETLKQAGIEYDMDPNISRGVSDGGNNDGKIQRSELRNLEKKGQEEADKLYGKGKGVKVYIANEILDEPNTMGYAGHVKVNSRGRLIGKRVIHIKKDSDPNYVPDMGPTLAHESGHLFTLGDVGPVDSSKRKYSDANGHTTEPNNFMNETIDPCNNKITPEQAKEIQEGAKRMCACVKQVQLPDSINGCVVSTMPQIVGGWVDDACEVPEAYLDLSSGAFYAANQAATLEVSILTEGFMPSNDFQSFYSVYLDTDNDDGTGVFIEGMAGVDAAIEITLCRQFSNTSVYAFFQNLNGSEPPVILPFASVETMKRLIDKKNGISESESFADGIYVEAPMYLFDSTPLGEIIECTVRSFNMDFNTNPPITIPKDEVSFIWENTSVTGPQIELLSTKVEPFEPIHISGTNFTPGQEVRIKLDDEPIGTVFADGMGNFFDIFHFDPGSDPFDGGVCKSPWHFVTAQDIEAKSDYSIIQLVPNIADLNADTAVDFKDFAIMADNWLVGTR